MCFVTKQQYSIILKKDKKVFKILKRWDNNTLLSQFQNFKYELNKLYSSKIEKSWDKSNFDTNDEDWYNKIPFSSRYKLTWIGSGFHAATTQKRLKNHIIDNQILVECTIPAGSIYYANKKTQLCVSNQIIINKVL